MADTLDRERYHPSGTDEVAGGGAGGVHWIVNVIIVWAWTQWVADALGREPYHCLGTMAVGCRSSMYAVCMADALDHEHYHSSGMDAVGGLV